MWVRENQSTLRYRYATQDSPRQYLLRPSRHHGQRYVYYLCRAIIYQFGPHTNTGAYCANMVRHLKRVATALLRFADKDNSFH